MSALMRKHLTNNNDQEAICITYHGANYIIPLKIAQKYRVAKAKLADKTPVTIEEAFSDLIDEFGEPGALLKGLRSREGLTQIEFAKKINITQANLSSMERGKRPIGKEIAKRIGKKFKIDYRLFL